jgi:hypothetical protein
VLKELTPVWDEIAFPSEAEMTALEELTAALRPLQLLTVNVCAAHFNILLPDTIFQTASNALRAQQTHIAD